MPNIGPMELIIVAVIALIVLGPKRLPDAGRSLGRGMREFKSAISGEQREEKEAIEPSDQSVA
jgi:sec-independent protein translocase protein TatA